MTKSIEWYEEFPECDFCYEPAPYDGKTKRGPWANMCETHFQHQGYPNVKGLSFHRVKLERK